MKKDISTFALWGYSFICILFLTKCDSSNNVKDSEQTAASNSESLCITQSNWFPHNQTPPPEEGAKSPFADTVSSNEIFHQWSWQKFLWLTKPGQDGKPLFLNQAMIYQVTPEMKRVTIPSGTFVSLKDTLQAGSMNPMLTTNPHYNKDTLSKVVYYSIHMNQMMYDSSISFTTKIASDTANHLNNEFTFPEGSFELKAAWVSVESIDRSKRTLYYTTTAFFSDKKEKKEVALIGMHVVGVVKNHPEFIWATFQHDDLAPHYDWKDGSAQSTKNMLLFKQGKVKCLNGIQFNTGTHLGYTPYQVFDLFKYGVPLDTTGNFMKNTPEPNPSGNFNTIAGINKCVKASLQKEKDVWSNYSYNGSIWLDMDGKSTEDQAKVIVSLKSNLGKVDIDTLLRGSLNCSNVTMESFTQTFKGSVPEINKTNLVNCFTCHKSVYFNNKTKYSPLYLSHTFQGFLLHTLKKDSMQIDLIKTKYESQIMQLFTK